MTFEEEEEESARMITLYHVTNCDRRFACPNWPYVTPSLLRDATFDGPLVGLATAGFSR